MRDISSDIPAYGYKVPDGTVKPPKRQFTFRIDLGENEQSVTDTAKVTLERCSAGVRRDRDLELRNIT